MKKKENIKSLDELASYIEPFLTTQETSFYRVNGYARCDLGGVFLPTCAEMRNFIAASEDNVFFEGIHPKYFVAGDIVTFTNPAYRLFYEIIRKDTWFEFLYLKLSGRGTFQVTIIAQSLILEQDVFKTTIQLSEKNSEILLGPIPLATLPINGSLVLQIICLGAEGYINGFRWNGDVPQNKIITGQRIIAIRTFACRPFLIANLKNQIEKISSVHPEILQRFFFVIYDSSQNEAESSLSMQIPHARILELKGPNYGGGGNASILLSILLRCKISEKAIAEICLIDDDAQIDAEAFIRHDAFITARKHPVISTSVVYSRKRPAVIQESGGFWGRFFSPYNHAISLESSEGPRLFFPYLVKSQQDVSQLHWTKALGEYQHIEFATFIFISFPYEVLHNIGVPLPLFLRNDDVEICLRANAAGYKIVANPNIHAWHDSIHNPIGEFYASLHALIINTCYGGIDKAYFFKIYLEKISKLIGVKNILLLKIYKKILELFSLGPEWMNTSTVYKVYSDIQQQLKNVMEKNYKRIPIEVQGGLKDHIDIINIIDCTPPAPSQKQIVFIDITTNTYYTLINKNIELEIEKTTTKSINYLAHIANNFVALTEKWKIFIEKFDHIAFWNNISSQNEVKIINHSQVNNKNIEILNNNYCFFINNFNKEGIISLNSTILSRKNQESNKRKKYSQGFFIRKIYKIKS